MRVVAFYACASLIVKKVFVYETHSDGDGNGTKRQGKTTGELETWDLILLLWPFKKSI